MNYYGSICLSDIPKRLIKEINGKLYLNIDIVERREVGNYGDTHFIAATCKQDERVEGENRYIGHMRPSKPKVVTTEDVASAPTAEKELIDYLPF